MGEVRKDIGMGPFCNDVDMLIGQDLHVIGATRIKETTSGDGFDKTETCFFSASDRVIAITFSPRNGAACFIKEAGSGELSQYETWDSLWHLLEMDKNTDTDEGLSEYLTMFPQGYKEFLEFIGTSLVKYFGSLR